MKKCIFYLFIAALTTAIIPFCVTSCNTDADFDNSNQSTETVATGKISGKVTYSNLGASNHGGIIVTLDKTDGLRTISVLRAVNVRSVENASRSLAGSVLTANDGSYVFENLEAGTYTVYAASSFSKEKAVCTNVVVRSAGTTVAETLKLTATGNITGKVTLDEGTSGNTGFLVFIAGTSYMAITDDAGNYTISDVPAATGYQLVAMKNNVMHFLSADVTVVANESVQMSSNNFTSDELKAINGTNFLAVGTILNIETLTNQDVIITINVTKSKLAKIGYVYSSARVNWTDANAVLNNSEFVSIMPDTDGKYKIMTTVNGYYSIVVKDTDGYVDYIQEYISNIDKVAPSPVNNLIAKYDRNAKEISVTWINPIDSDFDHAVLSYTKDESVIISNIKVSENFYSINNVEVDGDEYIFTVFAVDKAGNKSEVSTVNLTPSAVPSVQSISLSRYHLAYNDPDQTVTAKVMLNNAELIEDDEIIRIRVKDEDDNYIISTAVLNKSDEIATATFILPSITTDYDGKIYTVFCKIGDRPTDTHHTARFNISAGAYLEYVWQYYNNTFYDNKLQIPLNSVHHTTSEVIRISGCNLDLITPTIQLYDSSGKAYYDEPISVDTSSVCWTSTKESKYQIIDTAIAIPTLDDCYSIKVFFDGVLQNDERNILQIYDIPKFSSFSIPKASITKNGNMVTGKIIGRNFDAPNTDVAKFNASCPSKVGIVSDTVFTVVSDSIMNLTFMIPDTEGDYCITTSYGMNSIRQNFKVQDFSSYSVGDVLLTDGKILSYSGDNFFTEEQKQSSVGILCGFDEYGVPIGWLGVYNSSADKNHGKFKWAEVNTIGYNTPFEELMCDIDGKKINNDISGSDNWNYICSKDPVGTLDSLNNYPAFYFANNYSKFFGISGNYEDNWFIPSIKELNCIYDNKNYLNMVLKALEKTSLSNEEYWSSSLMTGFNFVWSINFNWEESNNNVGCGSDKANEEYVCVIRSF